MPHGTTFRFLRRPAQCRTPVKDMRCTFGGFSRIILKRSVKFELVFGPASKPEAEAFQGGPAGTDETP